METQEVKKFTQRLFNIINSEIKKIDPEDKMDETEITIRFRIKNSVLNVQCPDGCFKLSNAKCLCFTTHQKE